MTHIGRQYPSAGPIVEDVLRCGHHSPTSPGADLTKMFTHDQITSPVNDTPPQFLMFRGCQIFTSLVWPCFNGEVPVKDVEWLEAAYQYTQSPGIGVLLYSETAKAKYMESVFQYLSNPSFTMSECAAVVRKVMRGAVGRRDSIFKYQSLLQKYPIAVDTLGWLTPLVASEAAQTLYVRGVPAAAAYIPPANMTVELTRTAIDNALSGRWPTSKSDLHLLYIRLLSLGGAATVKPSEVVGVMMLDPKLGFGYLKAQELPFNESLSVVMTTIHRRGPTVPSHEHLDLVSTLYDIHGPSDQWPTLDNVIKHVSIVTQVPIQPPVQRAPMVEQASALTITEQKRGFE